jgi:outer membrane lipoprotein LolB
LTLQAGWRRGRRLAGRWAAGSAVALLTACASLPPPAADSLSGRLSVRVDGQPAQSVSAGFELHGNAQRGSLVLSGPLGTTAARATWAPGQALLQQGSSETRHADLDSLGQAALGEALPMAALFDWLHGRAWAQAPSQPRPDGQPGFQQLGWQIDLSRWPDGAIEAVRLAPPTITVRARVELPL